MSKSENKHPATKTKRRQGKNSIKFLWLAITIASIQYSVVSSKPAKLIDISADEAAVTWSYAASIFQQGSNSVISYQLSENTMPATAQSTQAQSYRSFLPCVVPTQGRFLTSHKGTFGGGSYEV